MDGKKIRTLLVEDEARGRKLLKSMLLEFCPDIELIGEAAFVDETIEKANKGKPDLLIMDIALFNETAFDALDKINHPQPEIIFTTAYDNFALRAFKYSVTDYLMKPIGPTDLIKAIEKVRRIITAKNANGTNEKVENKSQSIGKIALPTLNGLVIKDVNSVLYIAADGNYSRIYFVGGESILISESIKEYEDILNTYMFFRVHKSFIVNTIQIKKYLKGRGGYVVMSNDELIPVAARRRNIFMQFLKDAI